MAPLKKNDTDKVTLRDLMELKEDISGKIDDVKDDIQCVLLKMEKYKIKAIVVSAVISLIVSVSIGLGVKYGFALIDKIIF